MTEHLQREASGLLTFAALALFVGTVALWAQILGVL